MEPIIEFEHVRKSYGEKPCSTIFLSPSRRAIL